MNFFYSPSWSCNWNDLLIFPPFQNDLLVKENVQNLGWKLLLFFQRVSKYFKEVVIHSLNLQKQKWSFLAIGRSFWDTRSTWVFYSILNIKYIRLSTKLSILWTNLKFSGCKDFDIAISEECKISLELWKLCSHSNVT